MAARPGELMRALRRALHGAERAMAAELVANGHPGLSHAHQVVLRGLDPAGSRMSDIARDAGVTRQAVAQTVAAMTQIGLIEVVPDPADGRAKLVRYTERGQAAYAIAMGFFDELERRLAAEVGARRVAQLREDLIALRRVAVGPDAE